MREAETDLQAKAKTIILKFFISKVQLYDEELQQAKW